MSVVVKPIYFGPNHRPLFGWLHAPSNPRNLGVVICDPYGFEAVCAHRSIRHLADAVADSGHPTLRFNYDGTGDSSGCDTDTNRLQAWIRSIHDAIDALRNYIGVENIVLVGLRLGATLAALACAERSDISALAAIAPVVTVKSYLRELRALQTANNRDDIEATESPILEAAGFQMTRETYEALLPIDLLKLQSAPTKKIIVVDRDDLPSNDKWATHLRTLGAEVDERNVPGYAQMMQNPHDSIVPQRIIDTMCTWLASTTTSPHGRTHIESIPDSAIMESQDDGTRVPEKSVFLDQERRLFGVVSTPTVGERTTAAGVLLLNAGSTYHIGPNRLYVSLARKWAMLGYVVLRMDLSGIGDSRPQSGDQENIVYTSHAAQDVKAALAYLQQSFGIDRCHAIGLCSGAYHALKAAMTTALRGVVMINPLVFQWEEGMSLANPPIAPQVFWNPEKYHQNLFKPSSWWKLIRGKADVHVALNMLWREISPFVSDHVRRIVKRIGITLPTTLGYELETLTQRRVKVSFIFSSLDPGLDLLLSLAGPSVKRLSSRGQLSLEVIANADHTFTSYRKREALTSLLTAQLMSVKHEMN